MDGVEDTILIFNRRPTRKILNIIRLERSGIRIPGEKDQERAGGCTNSSVPSDAMSPFVASESCEEDQSLQLSFYYRATAIILKDRKNFLLLNA